MHITWYLTSHTNMFPVVVCPYEVLTLLGQKNIRLAGFTYNFFASRMASDCVRDNQNVRKIHKQNKTKLSIMPPTSECGTLTMQQSCTINHIWQIYKMHSSSDIHRCQKQSNILTCRVPYQASCAIYSHPHARKLFQNCALTLYLKVQILPN